MIDQVRRARRAARPFLTGPGTIGVDIAAEPGDAVITGTVPGVREATPVSVSFSRLSAKHRLPSWLELLALTATHPDREWRAVTIGAARPLGPRTGRRALGRATVLADLVALLADRAGRADPVRAEDVGGVRPDPARQRPSIEPCGPEIDPELYERGRDPSYEQFFGAGVSLATADGRAGPGRGARATWASRAGSAPWPGGSSIRCCADEDLR